MNAFVSEIEMSEASRDFQRECIEIAGTASGVIFALLVIKPLFAALGGM